MICTAEASAYVFLPEYDRAHDIDLAIFVAVESFVNAQKMSIKKTLRRMSTSFSLHIILGLSPLMI